jgi:hypothetical protein
MPATPLNRSDLVPAVILERDTLRELVETFAMLDRSGESDLVKKQLRQVILVSLRGGG